MEILAKKKTTSKNDREKKNSNSFEVFDMVLKNSEKNQFIFSRTTQKLKKIRLQR